MRFIHIVAIATLLVPGCTFAASREQQEMQRDIAQLQDQVRALQSGFDQKMAALQTLVQQAVDAGNKANTTMSVLNAGVTSTLDRELRDRLTPVAGLSVKVDNATSDISELKNSVGDLASQMNKVLQAVNDVNLALKVIQSPPAAPPPVAGGQAPATTRPPAQTIYTNAVNDYNGGKLDLALGEFNDFIEFYPDDPYAANAQLTIGQIHLMQHKADLAVKDFDAVLERYPDNKVTSTAYLQKANALQVAGHRDAAVTELRTLIKKYPSSDDAKQAREQLRALGVSATPTSPAVRKRPAQ
jgi:TolA-binding protein